MNGDFLATKMYWRLPESCGTCRCGRNARRVGPREARLCEPRKPHKSHKTVRTDRRMLLVFFTCRTQECGWLIASVTSSEDGLSDELSNPGRWSSEDGNCSLSCHLRGACVRSSQSFRASSGKVVLGGRKLQFVVSFTWCLCLFLTIIPRIIRPHHEPVVGVGGTQQEEGLTLHVLVAACMTRMQCSISFSTTSLSVPCDVKVVSSSENSWILRVVRTRFASTLFPSFSCCRSQ